MIKFIKNLFKKPRTSGPEWAPKEAPETITFSIPNTEKHADMVSRFREALGNYADNVRVSYCGDVVKIEGEMPIRKAVELAHFVKEEMGAIIEKQ